MFQNYLKIAFRHLIKNKLYSAINIFGLAVGLATCVLITLFVRDELSYDKFWTNADSIARINTTIIIPNRAPFISASASTPVKELIVSYFPEEVERATRFIPARSTIKLNDKLYTERVHFSDVEAAQMFDFEVLAGDMEQALSGKTTLAVDASFARKYFGNSDPIGKTLTLKYFDIDREYQIAAVFQDLPHNTSLDISALARFDLVDFPNYQTFFDTWLNLGEHLVYIQLKDPSMFDRVNSRLDDFVNTHAIVFDSLKPTPDTTNSEVYRQSLQRLTDIHLNYGGMGDMKPAGSMRTVKVFIAIAGLVLLIACINFMNLATANSAQRAREVAVRKVLGAQRQQLIIQFLGESVVIAVLGLILGLLLIELVLPFYNNFLGANLSLSYASGPILATLIGLILVVGLLAGVYPALVLSGFQPARVLAANKSSSSAGTNQLRNVLVVVQFTISISLIIATATVYAQNLHATTKDLGYSYENVLVLNNIEKNEIKTRTKALKDLVLNVPGVTSATYNGYSPIDIHERIGLYRVAGEERPGEAMISMQAVDHDFLDTWGVHLAAGRFYDRNRPADGSPNVNSESGETVFRGTAVINEEAVRQLGLESAENAIGKTIANQFGPLISEFEIIGVTRDIFFQSPKKPLRAEIYRLEQLDGGAHFAMGVRYQGNPQNVVNALENVWKSFTSEVPFQYEFVDQTIAAEFQREQNLATVLSLFSLVIVLVACLGLYGLASFTAQQRTREIGIRKVHGASVTDIVRLLLWQFSRPVLIASLIAWPLSIWAMIQWLQSYPVRLETWVLLPFCIISALIALGIAWLTVGGISARVAMANPVKALRCE